MARKSGFVACCARALGAAAVSVGFCAGALAPAMSANAGVPSYSLIGSFELPAGAGVWDVGADGRVVTLVGGDIYRQDAPSTSAFTRVGSLPAGEIPSFGAAFLRLSPGGTLAIGNNTFGPGAAVLLLPMSALDPGAPTSPSRLDTAHTEADWAGDGTLFVSGSDFDGSFVARLDVATGGVRRVITGINGAAGGVTTDGAYLYAANGFGFGGPSMTGEVRAVPLGTISGPSAPPVDFESAAIPVARALTGSSLGFDGAGNLLVGGGDYFGSSGDIGSCAVFDGEAVAAALAGGGIAPDSAARRLAPRAATDSYFPRWSAATDELLVGYYDNTTFTGGTTIYRYAVPVPGAGSIVMAAVSLLVVRRRREQRRVNA